MNIVIGILGLCLWISVLHGFDSSAEPLYNGGIGRCVECQVVGEDSSKIEFIGVKGGLRLPSWPPSLESGYFDSAQGRLVLNVPVLEMVNRKVSMTLMKTNPVL